MESYTVPISANKNKNKSAVTCTICKSTIGRKADLPRHMRIHAIDKDIMMFRCTFEGCTYKNLQKSNLRTHMRTHTGEKNQCCPDCEFATADPGSLTRHRKTKHGYQPKPRIARGKAQVRYAPYALPAFDYASDVSAESNISLADLNRLIAFENASTALDFGSDIPASLLKAEFFWTKSGGSSTESLLDSECGQFDVELAPQSAYNSVLEGPVPSTLTPGFDAVSLAAPRPSIDHFGYMSTVPFDQDFVTPTPAAPASTTVSLPFPGDLWEFPLPTGTPYATPQSSGVTDVSASIVCEGLLSYGPDAIGHSPAESSWSLSDFSSSPQTADSSASFEDSFSNFNTYLADDAQFSAPAIAEPHSTSSGAISPLYSPDFLATLPSPAADDSALFAPSEWNTLDLFTLS